jgi:hypothetical protein
MGAIVVKYPIQIVYETRLEEGFIVMHVLIKEYVNQIVFNYYIRSRGPQGLIPQDMTLTQFLGPRALGLDCQR